MKKFMILALCLFATVAGAQTINGFPLDSVDVPYVRIVGTAKLFSTKVNVQLDFGQHQKYWTVVPKDVIRDSSGDLLTLNSMVDALNFMSANGYEFVQAYTITVGNQNVYHYLLRRKED